MPASPDDQRRSRFEVDMTPKQYERAVYKLVCGLAGAVPGGRATFDETLDCSDGSYQMDAVLRLALPPPGGNVVLLFDAKHRKRVERSDLQELHAKVVSCGAHKGVIVASGRFQSGALQYGRQHGIGMFGFVDQSLSEFRDRRSQPGRTRPVAAWLEPTERGVSMYTPDDPVKLAQRLLA